MIIQQFTNMWTFLPHNLLYLLSFTTQLRFFSQRPLIHSVYSPSYLSFHEKVGALITTVIYPLAEMETFVVSLTRSCCPLLNVLLSPLFRPFVLLRLQVIHYLISKIWEYHQHPGAIQAAAGFLSHVFSFFSTYKHMLTTFITKTMKFVHLRKTSWQYGWDR